MERSEQSEMRERRQKEVEEMMKGDQEEVLCLYLEPDGEACSRQDGDDDPQHRSTPLITACQMGRTEEVQSLLNRGADITLCNYSNQTALHVSPPHLQGAVLGWISRPNLPPQAQLLQAAWQGDLHTIQYFLAEADMVDVNVCNGDGVTPVMLAVRDIDLFEGLATSLPWEHRPVEVVKELLALSADLLSTQDHRGCSPLHYALNINSSLKEEIIQMMIGALKHTASVPPLALVREPDSELGDLEMELDLDSFHPTQLSADNPSPNHHHFLLLNHTKDVLESSESVPQLEHRRVTSQDKGIPFGFQNAMETLRDIRQAYQDVGKGSSRGLCLPSLNDRGRPWGHLDLASTYCLQGTKSPCLPEPPRHRRKNQAVGSPRSSGLLSVPQSCQFSQSAPTVMEPLLQSRAHTQIRLGSDTKSNGRKGSLPALCPSIPPRTPKLLAPLDGRPRNGGGLPAFKHYAPLKPISQTSVSSMARLRCRRLSWGSPRSGPATTRGGSEESGSSSSQSSIDLEDEDEDEEEEKDLHEQTSVDTCPKTIKDRLHFDVELSVRLKAVSYSEPREDHGVRKGNMGPHVKVINHAALTHSPVDSHNEETITHTNYGQPTKSHCENKDNVKHIEENKHINSHSKEEKNNRACAKEVMDEICHITVFDLNHDQDNAIICSDRDYRNYEQVVAQSEVCVENVKVNSSTSAVEKNRHLPPTVNLTLSDGVMMKPTKPSRNRERRYSKNHELPNNFQTNESFNVLAHKKRSIPNRTPKIKGNLRTSTATQVRKTTDLIINGEATASKVKSKLNAVKDAQQSTNRASPRKKVIELHHQNSKRPTPDKMLSSNNNTQKPERELKSARQPKRTVIAGTARSKSAVDYVTYKDMFQEIQSRDEGPAIYEMFAGPVYDNLRVSSSCEKRKDRHVQSAPSLKTRQNHRIKHKPLRKQPESNKLRRSPVEKAGISTKGKLKPVTSRAKPCLTAPPRKETDKMEDVTRLDWHTDAELDLSEDDVEIYPNSSQVQSEDPMLSVIEEVPSTYGSEMLKPSDNLITSPMPKTGHTSHVVSHDNYSHHMQGMLKNSLDNHHRKSETENPDHPVPEPIPSQSPVQRKINTWTSGSDGRTMSPVYQRFLDEAGEGPLTDDLLRCLAEELISLDERDVSIVPCPEDYESNGKQRSQEDHAIGSEILPEDITTHGGVLSGLVVDDTITWTKGEVLGRGAYGTVYCGLTSQGQLIAVKQVCLDASDPEAADREYSRLQEEVELLKNLCHANIVGFLGTLLRQQVVSIFMEYVPGGSIASILHRFGPLPERVLSLYTSQILEGVAYLHLNRVIHRDLKGNNIMLMPTGVVKLIDFGCARRLSCVNHTSSNSGDLLKSVHGTPYWMAPEVINETGHGRKSDIWSVGCTVFEMATGKPPLAHMDKMAALFYIGAQRGSMPSLPDGFSVNARHFVQVCLTSDQKLRPSANQLLMHPFIPEDPHTKHHCSHPHGKCG